MNTILKKLVLFSAVAMLVILPFLVSAEETYVVGVVTSAPTERFNNENWFTLPHPKVISFTVRDDGSAYGMTETGVLFYQDNVPNELGIRIQMFTIEDHYHYIIDGREVYSLQEFSQQLALAYQGAQT